MEKVETQQIVKTAAVVANLTNYLQETKKFEDQNEVIEKHVSSQILQIPNPTALKIAGQPQIATTVIISIIYVYKEKLQTNGQ